MPTTLLAAPWADALSALGAAFAGGLAAMIVLTRAPIARWFADVPNERSLHRRPVPRVGGLAIVAGMACAAPWIAPLLEAADAPLAWALAGAAALAAVSVVDDVAGLGPGVRLLAHLAVTAAWCAGAAGVAPAAAALAVPAIVWAANLYNFMDGADGLAGGMAVTGFGAYAAAAALAGQPALALACGAVAAAAGAFLCLNYPPARAFMGDAGSVPLGFLAGALGLLGVRAGAWGWAFPAIVFLPFAFDATYTLARRIMAGRLPWQAHREHLYQRAVRSGCGHLAVARVEHGVMLACALLALWVRERPVLWQWAVLAALLLAGGWAARRIDAVYRTRCDRPC